MIRSRWAGAAAGPATRANSIDSPAAQVNTVKIQQSSSGYFDRLDAVRGTAILWVFVFHLCGACWGWNVRDWQAGWEQWPQWLAWPPQVMALVLGMGRLGVPMFFVLSGFLIHYTFCRDPNPSTLRFWLRRFGRIYPPYFVALLVIAAVTGFFWNASRRSNVISHLLLIHNLNDGTVLAINGSFWSLAVEAQFYLLYPLLLSVRRRLGMAAVLLGALALRLGIGVWFYLAPDVVDGNPAMALMLPRLYFEWILGMYVADSLLAGRRALPCHPIVGWLCFAAAAFCEGRGWFELATVPMISVATAIWIDCVVHAPRRPNLVERLLIPMGVVSYSLYLWHQPIVNEVASRVFRRPAAQLALPETPLFLLALAVAGLLSAMVAVGSYRLTEMPAIEMTKKLITLLKNRHSKDSRATADSRPARHDAQPKVNQSPSIRKAA
jgi:peptidoglycan/LPS O-acetylase OafA/YrhL